MEELISSIYNNPEEWRSTQFTFNHSGGFQLWTANGFSFVKPYNSSLHVSFWQKIKVWRAYKWWCKNAPLSSLSGRQSS